MDKITKEKRRIFKKYMKTKKLTKEENDFCEKNDWHPVDELPLKKDLLTKWKKLEKANPINLALLRN